MEHVILRGANRDNDHGNVVCKTEIYWRISVTSRVVMECYTNQCRNDKRLIHLGMIGCADKKNEWRYRK